MAQQPNDPPMFPHTREDLASGSEGIRLRDYFAGQAIAGLGDKPMSHETTASEYAGGAYRLADALLAEREKKAVTKLEEKQKGKD